MAEQENGSSPLPRRWPGSVTGGRYWWSGRCPAGRSSSMTCSARSPGSPRISSPSALKRLEREGLLMAPPYSERPPRAAYQLTAEGTELAGALRMLAPGRQVRRRGGSPRHPACGTLLKARWYCPTCDHLVDHEPYDGGASYL